MVVCKPNTFQKKQWFPIQFICPNHQTNDKNKNSLRLYNLPPLPKVFEHFLCPGIHSRNVRNHNGSHVHIAPPWLTKPSQPVAVSRSWTSAFVNSVESRLDQTSWQSLGTCHIFKQPTGTCCFVFFPGHYFGFTISKKFSWAELSMDRYIECPQLQDAPTVLSCLVYF